jgi:hypothetical protein
MTKINYSERAADFALQEHSLLRTEIIKYLTDTRDVERNTIVAIGVVWGFLVLHPPSGKDIWAWWVAPLFAVMGALRLLALDTAFHEFSQYLRRTEEAFVQEGGIEGWETFLAKKTPRSLFATSAFFYGVILLATVIVAVYKSIW